MSAKYRGTSPSQTRKVVSDEANESNLKARQAAGKRNQKKTDIFSQYGYHIVIGGFVLLVVFALANTLFSKSRNPDITPVIQQDEINSHNGQGHSYQLGSNSHFAKWMLSDAKSNLNAKLSTRSNHSKCSSSDSSSIIPDSFDFRKEYPKCVRSEVYSQNKCASSYATSAASTIADRLCKQSNEYVDLSPQPLIDCDAGFSMGCSGGYVSRGFDFAKKTGLPEASELNYTGATQGNCDKMSNKEVKKHQIKDSCIVSSEQGIKREIYENGPVVTVLPIYRDFLVYKTGVYEVLKEASSFRSEQAIKIIGWDKDTNGRDYWIVENSWGSSWGENGYANIYAQQSSLHFDDQALAPVIASQNDSAKN